MNQTSHSSLPIVLLSGRFELFSHSFPALTAEVGRDVVVSLSACTEHGCVVHTQELKPVMGHGGGSQLRD